MLASFSALVAALSLVASAQQEPLSQYKAQFKGFVDSIVSNIPNPGIHDPVAALEAKVGSMRMSTLTLENWKETLLEPVMPAASVPQEWWVLITGGNKTCFGHCARVEQAFNETAAKFALTPGSPHTAYLNCDHQPILCNSWSASTANLWSFAMLPPPAPITIYKKRLNLTTTTSDGLVALHSAGNKEAWTEVDSWFHPFNGIATELGLSVPYAYIVWAFKLIPNWLFMLIVSFASRSMMSNRINNQQRRTAPGAQPAAAPRAN
ncbi:hypothetical protein CDD82_17 [Ophiocordyceps australis]|uniref:Peptidyl-tRNA hydrolase n=1 Tax=Ophiocordyceps australis TaxID=1399860 RepID=A0A2C5ZRV7_9HYPO|nr:hypothetical protein CDD82_17 [Ophiocordyceps australis]